MMIVADFLNFSFALSIPFHLTFRLGDLYDWGDSLWISQYDFLDCPEGVRSHAQTAIFSRIVWFRFLPVCCVFALAAGELTAAETGRQPEGATSAMLQELKAYPGKIVYQSHRDGNWELYLMNATVPTT